jgi:hypothetical protein
MGLALENSRRHNPPHVNKLTVLDILPVLLIAVFTVVLVYFRIKVQYLPARGPAYDGFAFLSNALTMAGKSTYYELGRPPLLPFLTSLFFRAGFVHELASYLIDGVFLGLGSLGLYLLLRRRFLVTLSLFGALIFMALPEIVFNLATGTTDVFAVCISIWAIYFTVTGSEKDPRLLIPVFPLLALSFLARYTTAMTLFPIAFYLMLRGKVLRNMKILVLSLLGGASVIAIDIVGHWRMTNGQVQELFIGPLAVATTTVQTTAKDAVDAAVEPISFFITNLPRTLSTSWPSWLILVLLIIGLVSIPTVIFSKRHISRAGALMSLLFLFGVVYFLTFSNLSFLLINTVFIGLFLFLAPAISDIDDESAFNMLVFLWFIAAFSYHSQQAVKVTRYFIAMAPQISILIVMGLSPFVAAQEKLRDKTMRQAVLLTTTVILTLFAGMVAFQSYRSVVEVGPWGIRGVKEACDWLRPKLKPKDLVYADYYVAVAWYLRKPIVTMPIFKDNRAIYHELEKYDADYFVSIWQTQETKDYHVEKLSYGVRVFGRTQAPLPKYPEIYLVGQDINHYLEDILDFKYYLRMKPNRMSNDPRSPIGMTFLDEYPLSELERHPLLLLYNFKWRNRDTANTLVVDYVKNGGTVVIDASGNSGQQNFALNNDNFLGVSIVKDTISRNPTVSARGNHKDLLKGVDLSKLGPFIGEDDDPWTGSVYESGPFYPGKLEKLLVADNKTLVGVQKIGKGKVIWIGYNLVFHAFIKENPNARRLVRNIFDFAVE